jgi:hypothetical protein
LKTGPCELFTQAGFKSPGSYFCLPTS